MIRRWFVLSLCIALILLVGDISQIFAQETASDEFTLEEITVTAQKREENQQKVPIQMEVISGEELAELGRDNVDEILRNVSNALINMSPDGMRVSLRGIAEEDSPWHDMRVSTPTVAINIDGSYNSSSSAGMNMFDIERVEVLSGPQSTLYGSNSPGGIVNVVTAAPKTDKYSATGSVEYGSYSLLNIQATLNAPVYSDKVAMRLAAQKSERGSWVDNGDNTSDTITARLKTLYQPNDKFSTTLTFNWAKRGSGGAMGGNVKLFDYQDGHYKDGTEVTNPWTSAGGGGGPPPPGGMSFSGAGNLVTAQPPPGPPPGGGGGGAMGQDQITKGISAEISWDTGFGSLSIVPSYNWSGVDDTREVVTQTDPDTDEVLESTVVFSENFTEQKNAEVRMASPRDAPFTWIVGATYYESDRENESDDLYDITSDSYQNSTQTNKGVYANITYPFTDKFRGNAGYRRSWDKASNVEIPAKVGTGITGQEYSNPDYNVGLEYDLADNSMLYVSYKTSYRVNGMALQGESQTARIIDDISVLREIPPEENKSYNIGVKSRFFENRVQVNTSAFYYDYKNKRFRGSSDGRFQGEQPNEMDWPNPRTGDPGTDLNNDGDFIDEALQGMDVSDPWIQQFGDFRSIGVDVSTDWMITRNDRLSLSVSYLNAEWTKAKVHFYWDWIWETEGADYSGRQATMSPKWSGTLSYQHNFTLWTWGTLVPHVDVQYKSSYYLSFLTAEYPYNYQEPYYLVNGNTQFTHSSGRWTLNAYVKNATNYCAKNFWMDMAGSYSLGVNDPRTYGANFTIRF